MRIFSGIAFLAIIVFSVYACGGSSSKATDIDAAKLFKLNCQLCHGANGALGANGSKNLQISPLTMDERINVITNGKNTMTPYKDLLSKEEIKALAEYTFKLK